MSFLFSESSLVVKIKKTWLIYILGQTHMSPERRMLKPPRLFVGNTLSWYYNINVGLIMQLLDIFEHINSSLLDLYYNTDKCGAEDKQGVLLASASRTPCM